MAKLPTVAIIGKPNAGKSTLFNRLIGKRKSIVSDVPGTTRDRIAHLIEGESVDYLLVDTGGMGGGSDDKEFEDNVEKQSELALESSDLILFAVNGREELTASDYEIAGILRRKRRGHVPVVLVVTKMDNPAAIDETLPRFYELGIGEDVVAVSAPHHIGIDELTSVIESHLQNNHFGKQEERTEGDPPRIAIVGKPNVGKSSIVNAFLSEAQKKKSTIIVSDTPGTTRDSLDTEIRYHGKPYVLTDTAGLKKTKAGSDIEYYAELRTLQSIEQADIAVVVIDASRPVSRQDKRIARMAIEEGRGLIFLLNKIDLLSSEEKKKLARDFSIHFPFCLFAPLIPCSANTREGLTRLFEAIEHIAENRARRIPTSQLNTWLQDALQGRSNTGVGGARYVTQVETHPPTFTLFVKDPKKIPVSELRFLENRLRSSFAFEGTPVKWVTKKKDSEEKARGR